MRKSIARVAISIVGAVGVVFGTPVIASANDMSWGPVYYNGRNGGQASFSDAANRVYVTDRFDDNYVAVIDVWREGNVGGDHIICNDWTTGDGASSCALIWAEDVALKGKLCFHYGPDWRHCTPIKSFHS